MESEIRTVVDDNAPPLISFYDDLIAEEQRQQQHLENPPTQNGNSNTLANNNNALVPVARTVFNNPKAVRVSNYQDHRWHDVLKELIPFGTILERFDQLRTHPNHEFIPTKVLAESDDEVVRQARLLFTGDGWTKVTYATREAADNAIAQNRKINIGGRDLVIEPWKPELHGRPDPLPPWRQANIPPATIVESAGTTSFLAPGEQPKDGFRQRSERNIFDPLATPTPSRPNEHMADTRYPTATPGGSRLSTVLRGAKVVTLREMNGGIFKQQPSNWSKVMSWLWGEVGPGGRGDEVKEGGWMSWVIEKLFGRL